MFALRTDHFELSSRGFIATVTHDEIYVGEGEEEKEFFVRFRRSRSSVRASPLSFAAASSFSFFLFLFSPFVSGPSSPLSLSLFFASVYIVLRDV